MSKLEMFPTPANATRLQIFSIYDKKAESFMPPFFMPTVGMAVRAFGDDVSRAGSQLGTHPEDFELYHLGGFNDFTADFNIFPPSDRRTCSRAIDHVKVSS